MRSLISDYLVLSKLFFIYRLFGSGFLQVHKLCFVLKRFIFGEKALPYSKDHQQETRAFVAEAESLLSVVPGCDVSRKELFKELQEYGINCNYPTGCLLMTSHTKCRSCFKELVWDGKHHIVVVYDLKFGEYLATRITKICRKCKISEQYGYWTFEGKKHYNDDALNNEFILISEETALDIDLLKDMSNLLIVGAVPFSTYASSYNRRFGLKEKNNSGEQEYKKR